MNNSPLLKKAYELAKEVRLNAHAPYSEFKVGCCIKLRNSDELITGCNVENASYGLTTCAERIAIFKAVSELGNIDPEYLVVVTDADPPAPPCGPCLQVMAEFCQPHCEVYLANLKGIQEKLLFKELLPKPFHLKFWSV